MPTRFDRYRFTRKTVLSDETFNRIWKDLDLRLAALEDVKKEWESVIEQVTEYGLTRIDEILRPSIEYIEEKKAEIDELVNALEGMKESLYMISFLFGGD